MAILDKVSSLRREPLYTSTTTRPTDRFYAAAPKSSSSVPSKVPSAPAAASTYLLQTIDIAAVLAHTYVGRALTWTSRPVDVGFAFMIRPATYTRRSGPRTPRALRDLHVERISSSFSGHGGRIAIW